MTQIPAMTTEQWFAYQNYLGQQAWNQQQAALAQQNQSQRRNDALSWEYQNKMDQANQKNESRYGDILQLLGVNRNNILGDLNQWGESNINDANQRYKEQAGAATQDAYARGFGGSPSVLAAGRNQANKSRDAEINRIRDAQILQRTGANERLTGNIAGVMERRNDVPPDLNQLIGLQQGLGRAGGVLPYPGSFAGGQPGGPRGGVNTGGAGLPAYGPSINTGGIATDDLMRRMNPPGNQFSPQALYGQQQAGGNFPAGGNRTAQVRPFVPFTPPPAPVATRRDNSQEELARRNAMYTLKGAYDSNLSGLGKLENINAVQNRQILGGYANWSPQQPVPTVRGMGGGPIGVGGSPGYGPQQQQGGGQGYPVYIPYPQQGGGQQQGGYPQQPYIPRIPYLKAPVRRPQAAVAAQPANSGYSDFTPYYDPFS